MIAAHDTQALARAFHDTYERLAPSFGYETRPETRKFDPESPNGKLMIAVVAALASRLQEQEGQPALSERLHGEGIGDLIFAVERWKSALTGDASTSALNALEALIVRLAATLAAGSQAVHAPGWRPIDSAPKHGAAIWAFNGEQGRMTWTEGDGWSLWVWEDELLSDVDPNPDQPTHWQPLPPPPLQPLAGGDR